MTARPAPGAAGPRPEAPQWRWVSALVLGTLLCSLAVYHQAGLLVRADAGPVVAALWWVVLTQAAAGWCGVLIVGGLLGQRRLRRWWGR